MVDDFSEIKGKGCTGKICSPVLTLSLAKTLAMLAEESTADGIHLASHCLPGARVRIGEPGEIDEVVP